MNNNLSRGFPELPHDTQSPGIAALIKQALADTDTLRVMPTPDFLVNGRPLRSLRLEVLKRLAQKAVARAYR